MAYPCFCTEEELSATHEQQEKNKENFGYYGKYAVWRDRPMEDIEAELAKGTPYVVRFRSEGSIEHKIRHEDLVKGKMEDVYKRQDNGTDNGNGTNNGTNNAVDERRDTNTNTVGDDVREGVDDAGNAVGDAVDDVGNAIRDGADAVTGDNNNAAKQPNTANGTNAPVENP